MKNQLAQIDLFELISHLSLNELTTLAKVTGKSFLTYARTPKMTGKFTQFANLSDEQLEEVAKLVEQRIDVWKNNFHKNLDIALLFCYYTFNKTT